jgi:hypothetical protein
VAALSSDLRTEYDRLYRIAEHREAQRNGKRPLDPVRSAACSWINLPEDL